MFNPSRSGRFVGLLALAFLAGASPAAAQLAQAQRPFTVSDSIGMTVLNDVNSDLLSSDNIELSPDGRRFFLVTRTGNLETGANDFTLWLYDAREVQNGIGQAGLPTAIPAARFSSTSNRVGIAQAKWTGDSRFIAFLGENPGETPQLYTVDVETRALSRLTSHTTPVIAFDIRPGVEDFIYAAEAPFDPSERQDGYEIGTTFMLDVMQGNSSYRRQAAFFAGDRRGGPGRAINLEPQAYGGTGLWLSPRGRYAIFARHLSGPELSWWTDYEPVNQPPFDKANDPSIASFSTSNPSVFLQYYLIDLANGQARSLLDAPTGFLFGGMALEVHWAEDEASVILSNTFLPVAGVEDSAELARRRASPAIVELDLKTGAVTRIVDLLAPRGGQPAGRRPFTASTLTAGGDLIVSWHTLNPAMSTSAYRKVDRAWREVEASSTLQGSTAAISVSVTEGLNTPPELLATDLASGASEVITDLNPQLRDLALGQFEVLEGTDEDGRSWTAGLLKPIGYEAGKRYPLVIQLHGFDPEKFLVDGPFGSTSGYAARALANRGIMVLQLRNAPPPYGVPEEPVNGVKGVKAVIQTLDAAGLIDTARVGIHGFSRTGLVVQEALVFSDIRFAAASIADANALGMLTYLWGFGGGYPAMMDNEWIIGAPLWGEKNVKLWAERDPIYHLDRVHTPLRIDAYSAPTWFDAYAILRRHQKPVEYWAYLDSTHNPVKPRQRLTTQGGNVDWYDFWLNGREDPDPAKAGQYERWRELRILHEADLAALGREAR